MTISVWADISHNHQATWINETLVFQSVEGDLHQTAGLFALPHLSVLQIMGEDAEKFLQGQLSCDVKQISQTVSSLGCCCTPKGRIIAIFRIIKIAEQAYALIIEKEIETHLIQHLSKYIPFFKAKIIPSTSDNQPISWCCLGLSKQAPEGFDTTSTAVNQAIVREDTICIRLPSERFLIVTPSKNLNNLWEQNQNNRLLASTTDWRYLDIEDKIPTVLLEAKEQFVPHDVGLNQVGGISFSKGCYTGQEIIARMEYRGTLKQHAVAITHAPLLPFMPAETINIETEGHSHSIGRMIYSSTNSAGQNIALVCLKDSFKQNHQFLPNAKITSII